MPPSGAPERPGLKVFQAGVQRARIQMTEVIRLEAYRLKDNDDDALSEDLGTAMSFFLFLSIGLTFVYLANAPIKAP